MSNIYEETKVILMRIRNGFGEAILWIGLTRDWEGITIANEKLQESKDLRESNTEK